MTLRTASRIVIEENETPCTESNEREWMKRVRSFVFPERETKPVCVDVWTKVNELRASLEPNL